jgi:CRP-like cAMP-binding protein
MLQDHELRPGTLVDRCRVVQCLGQGRFGDLYEARESPTGSRVAVYTLRRSVMDKPEGAERFEQWVRSFASVRHPHLAETRGVGRLSGVPYFLAELPDVETLHVKLARVGALPVSLLVDLMLPVISVLAAFHKASVRLRVMPQGVFLAPRDDGGATPRVVSFALAEAMVPGGQRGAASAPNEVLPYLSPEEARGAKTLDARSDVWSVGATLYTAATGRRPFEEATREATLAAMLTRAPRSPRSIRAALPEAFEAVLMSALALDPAARYATAGDLARALLPFASVSQRNRWMVEFGAPSTEPAPIQRVSTHPPPAMHGPAPTLRPVLTTPATMTHAERRARLRRVPLFANLPASEVEALLASVRWRSLAPGDVLYRQGDAGDSMAFIAEGTVVVHAQRGDSQHEIARLGVGSILGEGTCLDPAPRSATVTASDAVLVGELSRDGLGTLIEHAPGLASLLVGEVIRSVAAKVREVDERIEALLMTPAERASRRPPPPPADSPANDSVEIPRDSARPRSQSGVWRFVDYLRRIS